MVSGVFFLQVHKSCNKTHFKAKKKYWVKAKKILGISCIG